MSARRTPLKTRVVDGTAAMMLPRERGGMSRWLKIPLVLLILYLVVSLGLGVWWSFEPAVVETDTLVEQAETQPPVTGYATTATLISVVETLLNKPGGWLDNDRTPPGIWLDNIPNFEFGALQQVRDLARVMRNDMSRSQSQSVEDKDLVYAETALHIDTESWLFPAAESEYGGAVERLRAYLARLQQPGQQEAQFYARADNLEVWIGQMEKRLGSLSQRLSASVGEKRVNTALAGDPAATQSTPVPNEQQVRTGWFEIDDVFFEARGATWALLQFLRAAEVDFAEVLARKNAGPSMRQIIRELEGSQREIWSPMILNGSGFGTFANHSLVMANYISRANAALIDLRELLQRG